MVTLSSGRVPPEHIADGMYLKHPLGGAMKDKGIETFETVAQKFKEEIIKRWGHMVPLPMLGLLTVGVK